MIKQPVTRLGTPVEDNEEPEGWRRRLLEMSLVCFLLQHTNEKYDEKHAKALSVAFFVFLLSDEHILLR